MEAARQDVEQEAADKLVGGEGHDPVAFSADAPIILAAEGNAVSVEGDEAPVRDGDAVGVA
jgi:hypothetical protein